MKVYWDSSALVEAALDVGVRKALRRLNGHTRPHALAEFCSALTGGRLGYRCGAEDAARIAGELAEHLDFVEMDAEETLAALAASKKRGVRGGLIHDFMHAAAAGKAGADVLFTLNLEDFTSLGLSIAIKPPPHD